MGNPHALLRVDSAAERRCGRAGARRLSPIRISPGE